MFQGLLKRMHLLKMLLPVFIAAFVSGCLSVSDILSDDEPPPPPPELVISVISDSLVNLDFDGRPSPTVVRIYQLEDDASFKESDFLALYDKDADLLSGDLLLRDEMIIHPGSSEIKKVLLDEDAEFVGVLAAFQNTDDGVLKQSVAVNAEKDQSVMIRLKENKVQLELLD